MMAAAHGGELGGDEWWRPHMVVVICGANVSGQTP